MKGKWETSHLLLIPIAGIRRLISDLNKYVCRFQVFKLWSSTEKIRNGAKTILCLKLKFLQVFIRTNLTSENDLFKISTKLKHHERSNIRTLIIAWIVLYSHVGFCRRSTKTDNVEKFVYSSFVWVNNGKF